MVSVYFFIPNLIGYVRVITGLAAFAYAQSDYRTFFVLYGFSYALDALDGVAARKFNQCTQNHRACVAIDKVCFIGSSFGAVLDMVTDRFCTAALLAILANLFPDYSFLFLSMMILDIVSHWVGMYSKLLTQESHKHYNQDENFLLRFYYTFPYALFCLCVGNETFLLATYLQAFMPNDVIVNRVWIASVWFFVLKQVISVVQLCSAMKRIAQHDERARAAKQ